jgi:hypothetical protein
MQRESKMQKAVESHDRCALHRGRSTVEGQMQADIEACAHLDGIYPFVHS